MASSSNYNGNSTEMDNSESPFTALDVLYSSPAMADEIHDDCFNQLMSFINQEMPQPSVMQEEETTAELIARAEAQIEQQNSRRRARNFNTLNASSSLPIIALTDAGTSSRNLVKPIVTVELLDDDDEVVFVSSTKNTAAVVDLCSPPLASKSRKRRNANESKSVTHESPKKQPEVKAPEPDPPSPTKSFICAICMDSPIDKQPQSTICGHIFCHLCIKTCVATLKKCAVCTRKLTMKQFHPIFL